jgi:hypothetical protein
MSQTPAEQLGAYTVIATEIILVVIAVVLLTRYFWKKHKQEGKMKQ